MGPSIGMTVGHSCVSSLHSGWHSHPLPSSQWPLQWELLRPCLIGENDKLSCEIRWPVRASGFDPFSISFACKVGSIWGCVEDPQDTRHGQGRLCGNTWLTCGVSTLTMFLLHLYGSEHRSQLFFLAAAIQFFFFLTLGGKPISIAGTFEFIRGMIHVCLQSAVGNESEGWSHLSMSKPSDTEMQDLEFALLGFGHAVV